MDRRRGFQTAANLATLVNALLGVDAIAYTLAGNKLFGLLLIVGAIGFDGLDGMLHRLGGGPPTVSGRVLDSTADAISFGVAPAVFLAVHSYGVQTFAPYSVVGYAVAALVMALAFVRLIYFTVRGYARPHFVGASTPQTTLALVLLLLFLDQPAFYRPDPVLLFGASAGLALLMVLPIPYPKIRRGEPTRPLMTLTSLALAVALVVAQFVPARGSPAWVLSEAAAAIAAAGIALFYLLGPFTVRGPVPSPPEPPSPEGPAHA